jgi:protein-S-isoprenylcysteine O-methyltransferase Ste14
LLVLRAVLFTLILPGSVSAGIPYLLSGVFPDRFDLGGWRYVGFGFLILGAFLYLAGIVKVVVTGGGTPAMWFVRRSRFIIGTEPTSLVTDGIYRRTRNPLYLAVISVVFGQAVLTGVLSLFFYVMLLSLIFHGVVVLLEEPHLRKKYGEAYARYLQTTPRWWG